VAKYVALLRGINVGRNKRVAMSDLRSLVEGLGYAGVSTHLQSGNVIFTGGRKSSDRMAAELSDAIRDTLGMTVSVIVRSGDELAAVVANNPMPEHTADHRKFMVAFLDTDPPKGAFEAIDPADYEPDRFALVGREIYIYYANGLIESKLSNEHWEKRIGVVATTRNWRTVTRLLELAS
jgi:uncharacterized protein (DUF1697 family)